MKLYYFGEFFARYSTEVFRGQIESSDLAAARAVKEDDEAFDTIFDALSDKHGWDYANVISLILMECDDEQVDNILSSKSEEVISEEFVFGIARTKTAAKVAFAEIGDDGEW